MRHIRWPRGGVDLAPWLLIGSLFLQATVFAVAIDAATPATPPNEKTAPTDVSFCEEVLILHHSHVDAGYTHPQSVYWELQDGYLDAALDMLDRTEAWPEDLSRPRRTAEASFSG